MQKYLCAILLSFFLGFFSYSLSTAQSPAAGGSSFRGHIDENGRIDIFDMLSLLREMRAPSGSVPEQWLDLNRDGARDVLDLLFLLRLLGR